MKEKTVRNITLTICIVTPLLPTYVVMIIIHPLFNIFGIILLSAVCYFGYMYIIALFIQRIAQRRLNKQQKRVTQE